MKKIMLFTTFAFSFILAASPLALAAPASQSGGGFTYTPFSHYVAVGTLKTSPQQIPDCADLFGAPPPLTCYSPQFLTAAYNFPSSLNGAGQTILIVDAYGSPTIASDLALFDAFFNIPAPPSFTVYCPAGCPAPSYVGNPQSPLSWSLETSLDVEYSHAMAPGANIVLVVAPSASGNAINVAEAAAIAKYPGSVMSQSFGIPEFLIHNNNAQVLQAERNYQVAAAEGITVFASAGDSGASNGGPIANANFPASSPYVTGVGGTMGLPYPNGLVTYTSSDCTVVIPSYCPGTYGGEQVWNEPSTFSTPAAGGGAPSLLFPVPSYQEGLGLTSRTTPDVAYNAAGNGGVLVIDDACPACFGLASGPVIFLVGGTSAGSPQWAAIAALADQAAGHSLGFLNPAIYAIGKDPTAYAQAFHDITAGNNILGGTNIGFSAGPGYDMATGWGTPNVTDLIPYLVSPPS